MKNIVYKNIPKGISREENEELFNRFQNGDINARNLIIYYNQKLVISVINRYFSSSKLDPEDLFQQGIIGLIQAVDSFNLERNVSFSSYAITCIYNKIAGYLKKDLKQVPQVSMQEIIASDKDDITREECLSDNINIEDSYIDNETSKIIYEIVNRLPDRQRKIASLFFGFNGCDAISQEKIAKIIGVNQSTICRELRIILKNITLELYALGVIEIPDSDTFSWIRQKTIYDEYIDYTKEEVDSAISRLNEYEKELITKKYGKNLLSNYYFSKLTDEEKEYFEKVLMPKIDVLIAHRGFVFDKELLLKAVTESEFSKKLFKYSPDSILMLALFMGLIDGIRLDTIELSKLFLFKKSRIEKTLKTMLDNNEVEFIAIPLKKVSETFFDYAI